MQGAGPSGKVQLHQAGTILPEHRGCAEHEMNREGAAALQLHQATSKKKSIETDPEYQVLSQVDG